MIWKCSDGQMTHFVIHEIILKIAFTSIDIFNSFDTFTFAFFHALSPPQQKGATTRCHKYCKDELALYNKGTPWEIIQNNYNNKKIKTKSSTIAKYAFTYNITKIAYHKFY